MFGMTVDKSDLLQVALTMHGTWQQKAFDHAHTVMGLVIAQGCA